MVNTGGADGNKRPLCFLSHSQSRFGSGRNVLHSDVAWLARDTLEPGANCRERAEVVVALMRDVGVRIERDVGDGVMICCEEVVHGKMLLHHAERAMAFFHPILEGVLLQLASAPHERQPKIGGAEIGLETVLL